MTEEMTRRLLSVKEACHYLHLSRTTLYHMIERKEITPVNIGGRTLFDRKDLDEMIEKAKTQGQQSVKEKGRKGRAPKQDESLTGHKKSTGSTRSKRQK
jgi:excisionase family DNA binding protein